jgi:hypothetical protein
MPHAAAGHPTSSAHVLVTHDSGVPWIGALALLTSLVASGGGGLFIESQLRCVYPPLLAIAIGALLPMAWSLPLSVMCADTTQALLVIGSSARHSSVATLSNDAPMRRSRSKRTFRVGDHTGITTWAMVCELLVTPANQWY